MTNHTFVDLFAGCGGLSLGLTQAGLRGLFAIERDEMAFSTFKVNFLGERKLPIEQFKWPGWLAKRAWPIDELLATHYEELISMQGTVDVLGGGPPCQGFSFSGKRQEDDPRNKLFEKYVQVVDAIRPSAIVFENVPGMQVAHRCKQSVELCQSTKESYFEKLRRSLQEIGYDVDGHILDASKYGVPQRRSRLIVIGIREDVANHLRGGVQQAFKLLEGWKAERTICALDAISDLHTSSQLKDCLDPSSPAGFKEAIYYGPKTQYQEQMHQYCKNNEMDSMRLARHSKVVRERFQRILDTCESGVILSKKSREEFGLKKHRIHPMAVDEPAPTITTLPDDVLHYEEPRILTVRESARLQSFPDWFHFRGKFTTGGSLRTKECPRYTQVGNAVPPLLGKAIGEAITEVLLVACQSSQGNGRGECIPITEELAATAWGI